MCALSSWKDTNLSQVLKNKLVYLYILYKIFMLNIPEWQALCWILPIFVQCQFVILAGALMMSDNSIGVSSSDALLMRLCRAVVITGGSMNRMSVSLLISLLGSLQEVTLMSIRFWYWNHQQQCGWLGWRHGSLVVGLIDTTSLNDSKH